MAQQDIRGSVAHATMLGKQNIIDKSESDKIVASLKEIAADLEEGRLEIDMTAEDIHTFVEGELTKRIGDSGKRLHTARSRNDQVALDLRLYLLDQCDVLEESIKALVEVVYAVGAEFTLVKYALHACVGGDVCTLPAVCGVDVAIWVVDVGTTEWARLCKVVYWTKTCSNSNADGNEYYHQQ